MFENITGPPSIASQCSLSSVHPSLLPPSTPSPTPLLHLQGRIPQLCLCPRSHTAPILPLGRDQPPVLPPAALPAFLLCLCSLLVLPCTELLCLCSLPASLPAPPACPAQSSACTGRSRPQEGNAAAGSRPRLSPATPHGKQRRPPQAAAAPPAPGPPQAGPQGRKGWPGPPCRGGQSPAQCDPSDPRTVVAHW